MSGAPEREREEREWAIRAVTGAAVYTASAMDVSDPHIRLALHDRDLIVRALRASEARPADVESERIAALMDALEYAWGIIANAYGGDWSLASADWRAAAEKWRDEHWHAALDKYRGATKTEGERND